MGPDTMILVFWMLSFKSPFSLSSFIKRLFSFLFSAIRVVSSASLRLLIFLPAILIPACASSSPAFHTSFSILNQSVVPCPILTVASWPAYRFLRRQVRWSGIPISWRIFQFVVIHTVKGFGIVSKAEIDVFLALLLFWWSNGCWQFDLWFLCLF